MNKTFGPHECEVSDDQVDWKPAIGNVGRYVRVKPELWEAWQRERLQVGAVHRKFR